MIETTQTVTIARPIAEVWGFARNISGWAALMPGLQGCEEIDGDNSRWVLKVGAGGMVRVVTVLVHVEKWDEPGGVTFDYRLEKDPVQGGGTYTARSLSPEETEVALHVRVLGSGPMAPMWEAMGKPLLPRLAAGFAQQFKERIEAGAAHAQPAAVERPGFLTRLMAWLRALVERKTA